MEGNFVRCPMCGYEEFEEDDLFLKYRMGIMVSPGYKEVKAYECLRCGYISLFNARDR